MKKYSIRPQRESDIIKGLAVGKTMIEMAMDMGISVKTVEWYWSLLKSTYGFRCYQDVTRYAIRKGIIEA